MRTVSSAEISASAVASIESCANWQVIGVCYWLRCSLGGCSIKTSPKIGHYRPDLVISVFGRHEHHPWTEARALYGAPMQTSVDTWADVMNAPMPGSLADGKSQLRFQEADAIGHPLTAFSGPSGFLHVCEAQTAPLKAYWSSALDIVEWRGGLIDALDPAALLPGRRELGNWPAFTWGAILPRTGWTVQSDPAKAAALAAQRAGDIVTRSETHRVRLPFEARGRAHWPPKSLVERDARTGVWQMVWPVKETSCSVFGVQDLAWGASWGGGKIGTGRDWIWNLWRPYKCCRRAGQRFLGSKELVQYP